MMEYVCIYPSLVPGNVLLIRKSKPAWQKGKLNLVGGKIEPGETVEQAARRELEEEASLIGDEFKVRGAVTGTKCHDPAFDNLGWIVWFLTCEIDVDLVPLDQEGWTEPVAWHYFANVLRDPNLVPNLKLIIPLLETKAPDWKITETPSGLTFASCNWDMVPCMTSP